MSYLSRLIEQTGIAVGGAASRSAEAPEASDVALPEIETFVEPPPLGVMAPRPDGDPRAQPAAPSPPPRVAEEAPPRSASAEVSAPPPRTQADASAAIAPQAEREPVRVEVVEFVESRKSRPPPVAVEAEPANPVAASAPPMPDRPVPSVAPTLTPDERRVRSVVEVREWVAATPAPDEIAPRSALVTPPPPPARAVPARRGASVPAHTRPAAETVIRDGDAMHEVHLSIGTISVIVEAPAQQVTAPAAAPPRPVPPSRTEDFGWSRLSRHYLRL